MNKDVATAMLIILLKASSVDSRAIILERYIQKYGSIPDKYRGRVIEALKAEEADNG